MRPHGVHWLIPLPPGDVPTGFRCVQVVIPDSDAYAQELGALVARASSWTSYERDSTHKAASVAEAWRQALLQTGQFGTCEGSEMQLRACESGCGIEYSTDGENWTCIDLSGCIETVVDSVLAGAWDDGLLGKGTHAQDPTEAPAEGYCVTYHAQLSPGSKWLCPSPVGAGDTVLVSNVHGGWSIGELAWYCGDGSRYLLGSCDAGLKTHVTGDPLNPDAYHMQVVGLVDTTYFEPLAGTYTVPVGTPQTELYFLANTDLTASPSGDMQFDVTVCTGGEAWEAHLDLRTSDYGFVVIGSGGHYEPGEGWQTTVSGAFTTVMEIQTTLSSYLATQMQLICHDSVDNRNFTVQMGQNPPLHKFIDQTATVNTDDLLFGWTGTENTGPNLWLYAVTGSGADAILTVTDLYIRGRGYNPFV